MKHDQSNDKVCVVCEKLDRWLLRITLVVLLAVGLGKLLWAELRPLAQPPQVEKQTPAKAK